MIQERKETVFGRKCVGRRRRTVKCCRAFSGTAKTDGKVDACTAGGGSDAAGATVAAKAAGVDRAAGKIPITLVGQQSAKAPDKKKMPRCIQKSRCFWN